ncbi:hypothetical protein B0H14DRAFT_2654051 [Mycena olivaceomarginata]|nr:hypothetical protein B0H14DRAFT_2654051 [Mycena olivaceomarginata]
MKAYPKADRRSKQLWAEGNRESILNPHIEGYTQALSQGWVAERKYWKKVCNEYHTRVDWRTPDEAEPEVQEWSSDHVLPTETLSPEEEVEKRQHVKLLNMRIRRWFKYRVKHICKSSSGTDPTKDPYTMLLAQLSKTTNPPKARQAFQQYMHESYDADIADLVTEKWTAGESERAAAGDSNKVAKAGFRAQVAREAFAQLPVLEQKAYGLRAKQAAADAREAYMERLKAPPSQKPQDRQSVSYDRNQTAATSHWAQWDKPCFASNVSGFMIEYLKTAYSKEDCAKAALPVDSVAPHAIGTEDDDSEPDSVFPSDEEDNEEDNDDDEEQEQEAGQMHKKRKVTVSNKGKGVARDAAVVGGGEQEEEHQQERQEWQQWQEEQEQEGEGEGEEQGDLWDDDPVEAVHKIDMLKRVAQLKIGTLNGTRDAARRIDDINKQLQHDIHARNSANEKRRQEHIAKNQEAMAVLQRGMAEVLEPLQHQRTPCQNRQKTVPGAGDVSAPRRSARHGATSESTPESGPVIAGSSTSTNATATVAAVPIAVSTTASITQGTGPDALPPSPATIMPDPGADPVPCPASALPCKFRPKQVTTWISNARGKRGETLAVADLWQYGVEWKTWWDSLQPEWREKAADGLWSVARGYGGGGTVRETRSVEWEAAVNDVAWMFEGIATYYELFNKRF